MKKKNFSIKKMIISVFMGFLIIAISAHGILIFQNWMASSKRTTEDIANQMNTQINEQINFYMYMPYYINETSYKIIQNGILDMSDEVARNKFFVGVLMSNPTGIYSFSFGTADGEYYGARRNQYGNIEIMKNDSSTGGESWYYSINDDMTMDELVVKAGKFDPRTRAWYQSAVELKGFTFSPVYKHFIIDDIAISASWPVYNKNNELLGVIGTHMLLSDLNNYLINAVEGYNGYALIVENGTNNLIGNSMGLKNYTTLSDGTLNRTNITDIEIEDIQKGHEQYLKENNSDFYFDGMDDNFYISIQNIKLEGVDWTVMSAIPESVLMKDITNSMIWAGSVAIFVILLILTIYILMTNRLLRPMRDLLESAQTLSEGNLSARIKIKRNDEIGLISESFNNVADKMQSLVENLEENVRQRTDELRLILDSAAEGIYGVDLEGNCTFCNMSCLKILGYEKQEDLIGKNVHKIIHHSYVDGTEYLTEDCLILKSIRSGKGYENSEEVFWKADNTYFNVDYSAYPQVKNGTVIGGVITFNDITERKKREEEIEYLSCYDSLTKLNNRSCFENNKIKIDKPENYPLSVIFADLNGLKMTNDIFGHNVGDELIKKSAEVLKKACRKEDIISRVGGDEFIILLPKTEKDIAEQLTRLIKAEMSNSKVAAIRCSMALGVNTKTQERQVLDEIIADAENAMYKDKTMNRQSTNRDLINTIIETLHSRSPQEKQHSDNVQKLCSMMGKALKLSKPEIDKLERSAYLHDIGKITIDKDILSKKELSEEEKEKMYQHPVVGYRILNLFDETLDLAEYIYNHHERWDGLGYPRGVAKDEIPFISRIIAVVETYDRIVYGYSAIRDKDSKINKERAISIIEEGSGKQFDPKIVKVFLEIMRK